MMKRIVRIEEGIGRFSSLIETLSTDKIKVK